MSRDFWNREYKTGEHLALSDKPSDDLVKFVRWLERVSGKEFLNTASVALDLGCGNGRNLLCLAREYSMRCIGYDVSDVAIRNARSLSEGLSIEYDVRSIAEPLPLRDGMIALTLDMMTSHFLREREREELRDEIVRVLKPSGWLFFKSFLADEDLHTKRLLRDYPADEEGAYIHPEFGMYEYVWTKAALHAFFDEYFEIHRMDKSHRHIVRLHGRGGRAGKRRTISLYLQKK